MQRHDQEQQGANEAVDERPGRTEVPPGGARLSHQLDEGILLVWEMIRLTFNFLSLYDMFATL